MSLQRSHSYSFPPTQQQMQQHMPRYPAAHSTSSAFSASANPNEDWTKISDLAERRRIQNRIAQRNYRKKLKRRLEDLEKKAATSSVSPEPSHAQLPIPPKENTLGSSPSSKSLPGSTSRASSPDSQEQQHSPELFAFDDQFPAVVQHNIPQFSISPSPIYSFPPYTTGGDYFSCEMPISQYSTGDPAFLDAQYPQDFVHSLPPTLPTMLGPEPSKQDWFMGDEDFLNPFTMNYASLTGMNMPVMHNPSMYSTRTPPLSDTSQYSDSREGSPPGFTLPMTPISRSQSPNVYLFDQTWSS